MDDKILSESWLRSLKEFLAATAQIAKKILLLEIESDQKQAKELVEIGIPMKGVRLWFLLASCLIASIGLNTNSNAVIIGAMLISPLMGPILGLGFGLATASKRMVRTSVQNLLFAVVVSLILATLYFIVSPFQDPTSEILARTAPNLLDLLVAIAAGFAGVVAMNSTGLAGAMPGVAIATAIMPPLCASAYGFAHADWKIAFGAFYLFFVNAVAIAVVAFLLFKRLHYTEDTEDLQEGPGRGRLRPAMISAAILLIVIPLGWSLWDQWRDGFVHRSISRLVQTYKNQLEIVSWQWDGASSKKLVLFNFRKATPEIKIELEQALSNVAPGATLEIHESAASANMEELAEQIRNSQLSSMISNPRIIEGLVKLASSDQQSMDLNAKLLTAERELQSLVGSDTQVRAYLRDDKTSLEALILIATKSRTERLRIMKEVSRYTEWLKFRLGDGAHLKIEVH